MALQVTSLSELDTTRVSDLIDTFSQLVRERHPEVELSRGVFHDLVIYFNSALNAAVQENIDRVMQSNSLLAITQNPALADPALVDKVLSNYNLTRDAGKIAVGDAVVVVNQNITTQINSAIRMAANGVTFFPTRTFTGLPVGQATSAEGDRTMVPVGDGTYAFKITVFATLAGAAGNIPRGTTITPDIAPSNVAAIFAAVDFTKGLDPATNAEYIAKLPEGLAAKTIGGRRSFTSFIRSQPDFQNILHMSVVGFGDAEQKRDQHSLFPVSGGGRVDIYAQTHDIAQRIDHLLPAMYIGPAAPNDDTAGTVWQVTLNKDTAPGFYYVSRIAKLNDPENTGYEIISTTPGYNVAGADYIPDITTQEESEFTRYKTLTLQFIDVDVQRTGLVARQSTATYAVTTVGLPLIGALQDFVAGREVRCRMADVLIKAAVPCLTTISFKVRRAANELDPDFTAIKKAIVTAVAKIGFSGQLSASVISSAAHQFLTGQQSISSVDIFGRILRPDGKTVYLRDPARIEVPNDTEHMVSPKTVVFLVSENDIDITAEVISGFGD
jgi:hypothetical protein